MSTKQHTPAQAEAIANANAHLNNVCLPLYSEVTAINAELLEALDGLLAVFDFYKEPEKVAAAAAARAASAKATGSAS